jgi:hypothetical protein
LFKFNVISSIKYNIYAKNLKTSQLNNDEKTERLANNITHFFAVLKLISIFADRLKPKVYGSNCIKSNPDAPVEALLFQQ